MTNYSNLAQLPAYPEMALQQDPDETWGELRGLIEARIVGHPRSAQVRLGPSEIGIPCARRLAYKLAGTPEVNSRGPAWRPTVGTAVHEWPGETLLAKNRETMDMRYLVEFKVNAGSIGPNDLDGHCDLYDRKTGTVVDWKIPGPSSLKKYKAAKWPGDQYQIQAHTYGLGWTRRGVPVSHVAIAFLPAAGELTDAYFWSEPYDETIALEAIARAGAIDAFVRVAGRQAPAMLPTADAFCHYCPWYVPAVTDATEACGGHRPSAL